MSLEDYYKTLPDYSEIVQYLDEDPIGFEPSISIQPFQPGYLLLPVDKDESHTVFLSSLILIPHRLLDFSKTILIDNVPVVDPDRAIRLKKLMLKIYSAITTDIAETDLYFPFDPETNMTPGYAPALS
jgi:hypothetical protein